MNHSYPTLHQLNIFRVASSHLSFPQAAKELCISASPVSHQIKKLEQQLQFSLFKRLNRALELTQSGRDFLQVSQDTLAGLKNGIEHIQRRSGPQVLRISLMPSIASQVVIPRLADFHKLHPDINTRIEAGMANVDFYSSEMDLAIRFGDGQWPGLYTEPMIQLHTTLVCSPGFAQEHQLTSLNDINRVPLINLPTADTYLPEWIKAAGLNHYKPHKVLWFDSYQDSIQAASQGLGLCLALLPLENNLLATEGLVAPFDFRLDHSKRYAHHLHKVCRPGDEDREDIQKFCAWFRTILQPNLDEQKLT